MRLIRMSAIAALVVASAGAAAAQPNLVRLYQGRRGPEQVERQPTRKIRIGRDGRVSIANVSGEITVTAAPGDEATIDAVKRGDRNFLDRVRIVIDDRPGRLDISTDYGLSFRAGNNVSVDYNVSVPDGATLDLKSISGNVKVTGVKGSVRVQSVSGHVSTNNTPRVEWARTVSASVDLNGVQHDGDLSVQTVSGSIHVNGIKVRSLDATVVSGDIVLQSASIERLNARSISGGFEYSGALVRNGRYEVNAHSGDVRFNLTDNTGFELSAESFSGSVRSDIPGAATVDRSRGRGPRREELRSTVGDGSAKLELRTFSGSIVITKK